MKGLEDVYEVIRAAGWAADEIEAAFHVEKHEHADARDALCPTCAAIRAGRQLRRALGPFSVPYGVVND